ncbi:hypothetical protein PR048_016644 [Dryococelus australis]|uniref:Uncharacterized protein n=1 Tax=Dryococelus australis TaxID=614101 RepID=A0ABQ9H7S5_9NEOP|nr:hypothetical protein PR048_016644 [Dryococelus australis]
MAVAYQDVGRLPRWSSVAPTMMVEWVCVRALRKQTMQLRLRSRGICTGNDTSRRRGADAGSEVCPASCRWASRAHVMRYRKSFSNGAAPECKGGGKREIPEKIRRRGIGKHDSHMRITGVIRPGIEPDSGAAVAERLARSPLTKANPVQSRPGHRTFANGNRAGRCHWSASLFGDLPFPPPPHSGAAPGTIRDIAKACLQLRCPKLASTVKDTLIGTRDPLTSRRCPKLTCPKLEHSLLLVSCRAKLFVDEVDVLQSWRVSSTPDDGYIYKEFLQHWFPPDFRKWESCRTMPLVGGFSLGYPVDSRSCIPALLHSQLSSFPFKLRGCTLGNRTTTIADVCGAAVAERLARSNRAQSPAGSLDFHKWESCLTMPWIGGPPRGYPRLPPTTATHHIHFNHRHRFSRPRCYEWPKITSLKLNLEARIQRLRLQLRKMSNNMVCEQIGEVATHRGGLQFLIRYIEVAAPRRDESTGARPRSRSEGAIRATLTRNPSASSPLRARRGICIGEPGSIPCRIALGFSHVGFVPVDAASWWVFSRISRFPHLSIPALLHDKLTSPSSALRTTIADDVEGSWLGGEVDCDWGCTLDEVASLHPTGGPASIFSLHVLELRHLAVAPPTRLTAKTSSHHVWTRAPATPDCISPPPRRRAALRNTLLGHTLPEERATPRAAPPPPAGSHLPPTPSPTTPSPRGLTGAPPFQPILLATNLGNELCFRA